ncbi:SusC/RagA family TonB-linked outer membrane protein [Myroides odoratimimus]|uniref:SusC/RagA family TonB-linked outer membrane protein n=1 Tax=Myroides odoratimimus TaxID=76832 RepID=UPI0025770F46|nr:TonB-dependent receptor [Myroides odoratimimus]MDM1463213.1 TonB-dependent receptor [Myroides odoratimimus]MDM1473213.1 TonB-dependent receptor [Myroides odoratimimus]
MKNKYKKIKFPVIALACLMWSNITLGQSPSQINLALPKSELTINELIKTIEKQTSIKIYYTDELPQSTKVNFSSKTLTLQQILSSLQAKVNLSYKLEDNLLSIKKGNSSIALSMLKGRVLDNNGLTLPGATIENLSNIQSTITDLDGNFDIKANPNDLIKVSFIGFQDQMVKASSMMNIKMREEASNLDEIVVIGYGTAKKKDITGSVGQVSGDAIEQRNTTQLSQALQGQLSGVMVTRNSSKTGAKANIKVRGVTTIGNTDPLIVVDGVAQDDMDQVNTNDIEEISVLKDAAAASIYGARAAAGVILITTKRAKDNEFHFSYKSDYAFEKPTMMPKSVGYKRYMEMINEMSWNDAGTAPGGEYGIYSKQDIDNWYQKNLENPNKYPITDWQDLLLKDSAAKERHSFSLSGGGERIKTRASVDYENIKAIYDIENYKRIMTRVNNNIKVNDFISGDIDLSYNTTQQTSPVNDPVWEAMRYAPVYAATWQDGRIAEGKSGSNAYASLYHGGTKRHHSDKIYGRVALNFTPIQDLKVSLVLAPQLAFDRRKNFTKKIEYYDAENPERFSGYINGHTNNTLIENRNESKILTKQVLATYTKDLKKHSINLLLGYEDNYSSIDNLGAKAMNMELPNFPYLDLAPVEFMTNSGDKTETAYQSLFSRLIYSFDNKYHLQANIRRDGSSRFHKDHRWGIFPSFSAGWTVSEENFMKNQNVISYLKLRGSWGTLGNERIGNYPYQSSINFSNTLFYKDNQIISALTAAQTQYAIQNITWETTESIDFGLDINFLRNRLSITADYYKKKTRDMLLELEIPAFMGFENPQQNAGNMHTKGWDLDINWRDQIGDLKYSIGANLSDSRTTMGDLGGRIVMSNGKIIRQGTSFNEWYGYISDGLFQNKEQIDNSPKLSNAVKPGDIKYLDISGPDGVPDGIISPDYDRVPLGSSLPRYIFGGHINLDYKGVELGIAFQGVGKQKSLLTENQIRPFQSSWTSPMQEIDGQYWSPYNTVEQNLNAKYPRLSHISAENNNYKMSDFWLINGAYFRIKNITLAYNFPKDLVNSVHLDKLKVFISLNDYFTFSNFPKGYDPESAYNAYIAKSFNFGVSVNF